MGTGVLTAYYWEDEDPDLRLNPGVAHPGAGLEAMVAAEPRLRGHVLFATSGSRGCPKIVCLAKSGVRTAAQWVNRHLGCGVEDCWLLTLPVFHVGGFGLLARVAVAGGRLEVVPGRWEAARFVAHAKQSRATVVSLVPTQVHDLVTEGFRSPESIRIAVIGGGRLQPVLRARAEELGWPVRESYGMTETAAQVATQRSSGDAEGWLPVIPDWEVRSHAGQIWLRGEPLLTAYLECQADGSWQIRDPRDEAGWFGTGDLGELDSEGRLRVQGRAGRVVKILGELVDLERLDLILAELSPDGGTVLEAVEDARAGWRVILVSEREKAEAQKLADQMNERIAPFERITEVRTVARLRRSPLGKRLPQAETPDSNS